MRFKKGDKVVYRGQSGVNTYAGNIYTVIQTHEFANSLERIEAIEIIDEQGVRDIYRATLFDFDKNRIVKDILNDL